MIKQNKFIHQLHFPGFVGDRAILTKSAVNDWGGD